MPRLDGLPLKIVVVHFPTRVLELNSIEPYWNTFTKRLKMLKVRVLNGTGGAWALKEASCNDLNNFTHYDIEKNTPVKGIMAIYNNSIRLELFKNM